MCLVRVKEKFHGISYPWGHVLELRVVKPVSGSVFDKRDATDIILVNVIVQTEKNAQARLGQDCVCGLKDDVVEGDIQT
jgi:hypothetical protein